MALISASGGNTLGFFLEHAGRKGVFQENSEDNEEEYQLKMGWWHMSKDMCKDALTSNQAYEVSKERSDRRNNNRMDAAAVKEATAAHHVAKMEGRLDFVEEANMALEALSTLADMVKLKVDYLEALIRYKGEIPEKGPKLLQVDQLKKLLDADTFRPFSPHVQIKYYKN